MFFSKLKPLGFGAIFARAHSSAADDSREHIYYRETPKGWNQVYAQRGFAQRNFVTRGARRRTTPFYWSNVVAPESGTPEAQADREMWGVLNDFNLTDGLAVPGHGPGYVGVISLAWNKFDHGPDTRRAILLASHYVHERMLELTPPSIVAIRLTPRERDCLAFVAEGKSDWDIAQILGLSQSTVHAHVENAKRRLGVKTRMQAIAKLARAGEI